MIIVAKIHNNSLGKCIEVDTFQEGIDLIKGAAAEQLGRELEPEELEDLENTYEFSDFSDSSNQYTWSVGETERV
jgi:hypothetical protein